MTLGELWRRLVRLFRRNAMTAELEEEMQLHEELRRRAMGDAGDDDAAAAARRRFGNRVLHVERSRDEWGFRWAEQLGQDVRYAARRLTQRPGFAMAVILVMALGIGATTAMFSAVDAALLRPLPFANPDRLVSLRNVRVPFDPGGGVTTKDEKDVVDLTSVAGMTETFSRIAGYAAGGLNLVDAEHPARIKVGVVTTDFFATLGVLPAAGRTFAPEEGRPGAPLVAILSHALWQTQFGGRDMLGRTIPLSGKSYTVVGVMPPRFSFPGESELWIPMSVPVTFATFEPFRGFLPSTVIGRVAPGVSVDVASRRMVGRWERYAAGLSTAPGRRIENLLDEARKGGAVMLQQELVGDRRTALLVLLGATGLLLLIACANVTNLLLSHSGMRRREIAVREVLGATRARVLRQLLTESMFLAAAGAVLGVLLAPIALGVMRALMPVQLAGVAPAEIDVRVLAFAVLLALVTGVGFGLWPALGSTRAAPGETIKAGGGTGSTIHGMGRARRILVGAELALTLMMLVGAGLMMRSFSLLMGLDRGMDAERVATLEISFPTRNNGEVVKSYMRMQKMDAIVDRVLAMPGIAAAGMVNDLPLGGSPGMAISVKVPDAPQEGEMKFARYLMASAGYFPTMGIRLLRGRNFTAADDSLAPRVAIISASMEKTYWQGVSALGRGFVMAEGQPLVTVVGIVADVREGRLERDPGPQMYFPIQQQTPATVALVARGTLPPAALLARLRDAVRAVDPSQAVYNVRMMDEVVSTSVAPRRANTLLISAFAVLALVLAALGVYAVVSYGVAQRAREFGIRSALGATGRDLVRHVAVEMVPVTVIGVGIGLAGAWALARVLTSLVYGVDVHDAATFVVVPLALVVPVVLATLVPARRAMRVNPAEVIRVD